MNSTWYDVPVRHGIFLLATARGDLSAMKAQFSLIFEFDIQPQ